MAHARDVLVSLIENYHELNPTIIDELSTVPNPLVFMRYVARNRPFVVRRGAAHWAAVQKWDASHLRAIMGEHRVKVAVTPHGNADAVVEDAHGALTFVEPWEIEEPFADFLDSIQADNKNSSSGNHPSPNSARPFVKYAQTQNDNLRGEYAALLPDVPPTIPFAAASLQQEPEAVNFWLGTARSTTALHKDNYENVYVQVRGRKHFTLLPPVEMACVREEPLPLGRYQPTHAPEATAQQQQQELEVHVDLNAGPVPVATWDPDEPDRRPTPYSKYSRPLRVTLEEGDMMYLPALWYHKVGQSPGDEGFACSVNYWYDMDFTGSFWATNAFVRDVTLAADRAVAYPTFTLGDEDPDEEGRAS